MVHRYVKSGLVSTVGALIVCLCGVSHGARVSQSPELNPGDQYRWVFTTSTVTDALSSDNPGYTTFLRAVEVASPFPVSEVVLVWKAIESTDVRDGRGNTKTNPAGGGTVLNIDLVGKTKFMDDISNAWGGMVQFSFSVAELDSPSAGVVGRTGTNGYGVGLLSSALGAAFSNGRFVTAAISVSFLLLIHAMFFRGL